MTKGKFTVQLHMHTEETSACARSTGAEMARACKEMGYDLIVITDHFLNANIGMPASYPYEERVHYLFNGYYAAKEEGDKIGLTVLKGWETFTYGPEYLTYGLDEEFLLAHPHIELLPKEEYLSLVQQAGGFCVHAHPYRKAPYIPDFLPDVKTVSAFEVYNAGNRDPAFNEQARETAKKYHLIETAGSDAHITDSVGGGAMRFSHPIRDNKDLIEAICSREGEIVEHL